MSEEKTERGQEQKPTKSPWDGVERRKNQRGRRTKDSRAVLSRGPIIRTLEILSGLSGVIAIASLIFALINFSNRLDYQSTKIQFIQDARQSSALDTCITLNNLIEQSVKLQGNSQALQTKAKHYLKEVGIYNCHNYSIAIRKGKQVIQKRVVIHTHSITHGNW